MWRGPKRRVPNALAIVVGTWGQHSTRVVLGVGEPFPYLEGRQRSAQRLRTDSFIVRHLLDAVFLFGPGILRNPLFFTTSHRIWSVSTRIVTIAVENRRDFALALV